jgi:hypothetical protein
MKPNQKPNGYWTKPRIRNVAKRYKNRSEFRKKDNGAYNAARRLGVLEEVCKHMEVIQRPAGFWTYEKLKTEALKFRTRSELAKMNNQAYQQVYIQGLKDDLFAHMELKLEHGKWNKKKVLELAKKHGTIMEFKNQNGGAYAYAFKQGFLKELKKHFKVVRRDSSTWTKREILSTAYKCKTRKEFYIKHKKEYRIAKERKWLKEIFSNLKMGKTSRQYRGIYAFEFSNKSVYIGLTNNYPKRYLGHLSSTKKIIENDKKYGHKFITFNKFYPPQVAGKMEALKIQEYLKKGWKILNKAPPGGLGGYSKIWTKKKLLDIAAKFNQKSQFKAAHPGAYSSALRFGLLKEVTKHMKETRKPNKYWTKTKLLKIARQYKTIGEFRKKNKAAYSACQNLKILDDIAKITPRSRQPNNFWNLNVLIKIAKKYKSKTEFIKYEKKAYQAALRLKLINDVSKSVWN